MISEPETKLNQYLSNIQQIEHKDITEMYAFAKEKFNGVIPMQIIKDVVDVKFRDTSKIRKPDKTKKISLLKKSIKRAERQITKQKNALRILMVEPFHIVSNSSKVDES